MEETGDKSAAAIKRIYELCDVGHKQNRIPMVSLCISILWMFTLCAVLYELNACCLLVFLCFIRFVVGNGMY